MKTISGANICCKTAPFTVLTNYCFLSPANPKITNIDDRRLPLELGKKLNVSCKATGNPAPTVQWVRIASNGGRVPVGYNNNTMLINSIQEKHYGDYACIAENTFGNDTVVFAVGEFISFPTIKTLIEQ